MPWPVGYRQRRISPHPLPERPATFSPADKAMSSEGSPRPASRTAHNRARALPARQQPRSSPERPATFSPADEAHEFRGLAPTCYTTCPQSSPGPRRRSHEFRGLAPTCYTTCPQSSPGHPGSPSQTIVPSLPLGSAEALLCRGHGGVPHIPLISYPPSLRKGLGDGETPTKAEARLSQNALPRHPQIDTPNAPLIDHPQQPTRAHIRTPPPKESP